MRAKLANGWDADVLAERAVEEALPKLINLPSAFFAKRIARLTELPDQAAVEAVAQREDITLRWWRILEVLAELHQPGTSGGEVIESLSAAARARLDGQSIRATAAEMEADIGLLGGAAREDLLGRGIDITLPNDFEALRALVDLAVGRRDLSEILADLTGEQAGNG